MVYVVEEQTTKDDRFPLVHAFILRQKGKEDGYSVTRCLKMFGVSKSGYYAWVGRQEDRSGKQAEKDAAEQKVMEMMRKIVIARSGIIPGKRTFRTELFRRFGVTVNLKRIARLMRKMHLVAQRPHRDAYKHQATHNHVCAAPPNAVNQDFFIGPRKVILTDITYLYYGPYRSLFYLCVFRDAYTRENLGWAMKTYMTTELVKEAYDRMMSGHGSELKDPSVIIHSDQGSQYLSTTFRQILSDDQFIQSVSGRGNSQDNAPMESFFGRLKTELIDLVALCRDVESATALVDGYLRAYNSEHFQYQLAGLTPAEFYLYATTGIYPLESYFGVPASAMMAVGDLKKVRRAYSDEEARQRREASARRREERRLIEPRATILRDQMLLSKSINRWREQKDTAERQIGYLQRILEEAERALRYVEGLSAEALELLRDPLEWRKHDELLYVFSMAELF